MLVGAEGFIDAIKQVLNTEEMSDKDRENATKAVAAIEDIASSSDENADYQTTMSSLMDVIKGFEKDSDG